VRHRWHGKILPRRSREACINWDALPATCWRSASVRAITNTKSAHANQNDSIPDRGNADNRRNSGTAPRLVKLANLHEL
jgi:hypothetical protein